MNLRSFELQNDTIFIRHLSIFLYHLGIVPVKPTNPDFKCGLSRKLYVLVLLLIFIFCLVIAFWGRIECTYFVVYSTFDAYLDCYQEILLFLISVLCLVGGHFYYVTNWRNIFNLIVEIDMYFHNKRLVKKTLKIFYLEVIVWIFIMLTCCLLDFLLVLNHYKTQVLHIKLRYVSFYLGIIYSFLMAILIMHILKYIHERYAFLNECLQLCCTKHEPEAELRRISIIHRKIAIFIEEFNEMFGWYLFLYIAFLVVMKVVWIHQVLSHIMDWYDIMNCLSFPFLTAVITYSIELN